MAKVFVVGLGRMGRGIVKNLVRRGHSVSGYDVNKEAYRALEGVIGFTPSDSLSAALGYDYVLLLLPTARELLPTLEALSSAQGVVINMTTIGLEDAKAAAMRAPPKYITAMIEGGPANAEAGTMTLYVGGPKDVYEQSAALLRDLGTPIYIGSHEAATAMKLFSTAILLANVAVLAEVSQALLALGVDPDLIVKALSSGGADSAQLRSRLPLMLSRSYKDLFSAELGAYVIREAVNAARSLGSPYLPLLTAVGELLEASKSVGLGLHDVSEVAELYRALSMRKG
ncbi:MAG: NAD(P)-dependent oxidoreductase [Acidilobus sp.]